MPFCVYSNHVMTQDIGIFFCIFTTCTSVTKNAHRSMTSPQTKESQKRKCILGLKFIYQLFMF